MEVNRRITIEKKIEAVEYAIASRSNYKAAEKFGVSEWTIRYWRGQIDKLRKASKTKITIHKGPPISDDTLKTDLKLLEFYEINRKLKNPISTYSLKIELLKIRPDLIQLSPHGQLEYIYRFMQRNNLSLRVPGHIGRLLPKDTKQTIIDYIIDLRKTIKEGGYGEYNIINMDETPLYLNMVPNKTIARKGTKNVVIRTNNQEKIRVTCILSVCADGDKLSPYIIFKGKNSYSLSKLNNNKYIKDHKIFININNNAWSTTDIINDWLDKVYLPYINKDPLLGSGLLIMDKASSHINEDIIEKCTGQFCDVSILPSGCTSILQPLDISINKPFKNSLKEKYIRYCIDKGVVFSKVGKEDIINWVGDIWFSDKIINKELIKNSFKVCGLSNKIDGSEDDLIKVLDFLENKTNDIDDEDEEYIKNDLNDKEDIQLKMQEKIFGDNDY